MALVSNKLVTDNLTVTVRSGNLNYVVRTDVAHTAAL